MNNNSKEELKADLYMLSCIRKIEKVFSCRLMDVTAGKEMNLIDFFLCLAKKNYLSESVLPLLNIKLMQLVKTTVPCSDDTESIAREKILMRVKTCALAAELQKMVEHVPAVEEWRRIGKDKNEFMEIREVKWQQKKVKKLQFFSIFSSQIQFYYVYISRTC